MAETEIEAEPNIGEQRRRALLEAAFSVIAEKGLEGLRTRDVATRAGVNISTLHYYFGTKDDLVLALIAFVSDAFDASARESQPEPESLADHLAQNWRIFRSNPHLSIVLQELMSRAIRDPAARTAFRNTIESWNATMETILRHGMATGELRADLDPRAAARVCTSFVMGALTQQGVTENADFMDVARAFEQCFAAPARKTDLGR